MNILMNSVFFLAIICLALPEIHLINACTIFIVNFISQSRDVAQANIVQTCGESLVMRIILHLGKKKTVCMVDF